MKLQPEHTFGELERRQTAILVLQYHFGEDIKYTVTEPQEGKELLIRADVPTMMANARENKRDHIVKISDTDRKTDNTVSAQLIHCLGPVLMKTMRTGDSVELYIQTDEPVLAVQSTVVDGLFDVFMTQRGKFIDQEPISYDTDTINLLLDAAGESNQLRSDDGLFIWPDIAALRQERAMDSIRASIDLNDPHASHYKALMIDPGAFIIPVYSQEFGKGTKVQLVVHASGFVGV